VFGKFNRETMKWTLVQTYDKALYHLFGYKVKIFEFLDIVLIEKIHNSLKIKKLLFNNEE
jgi:hypothetical protein